jgi:hypothetical protein
MKVKQLKKLLEKFPDNYEVVISSDGEGNSYSPLADAGETMYVADSTWSGEIRSEEDCKDFDEDYKENAVVLWPTN